MQAGGGAVLPCGRAARASPPPPRPGPPCVKVPDFNGGVHTTGALQLDLKVLPGLLARCRLQPHSALVVVGGSRQRACHLLAVRVQHVVGQITQQQQALRATCGLHRDQAPQPPSGSSRGVSESTRAPPPSTRLLCAVPTHLQRRLPDLQRGAVAHQRQQRGHKARQQLCGLGLACRGRGRGGALDGRCKRWCQAPLLPRGTALRPPASAISTSLSARTRRRSSPALARAPCCASAAWQSRNQGSTRSRSACSTLLGAAPSRWPSASSSSGEACGVAPSPLAAAARALACRAGTSCMQAAL